MEHGGLSFDNRVLWTFGDHNQIWITESILNTWYVMAFLTCVAIIVRIKLNKFNEVPTGFQNFIEFIVDSMDNFVTSTMGAKYSYFGNYFFGVFCFIMASNFCGLFGIRPPTTDLATTVALAGVTFVLIHFMGILTHRAGYFKEYFEPVPLFFPIHLVGAMTTPISLSFRLFGNILGGFIILGMIYELFPWFLKIGLPAPLHVYFDLFAGTLQAFIFTVLSMTFIREKIPE